MSGLSLKSQIGNVSRLNLKSQIGECVRAQFDATDR